MCTDIIFLINFYKLKIELIKFQFCSNYFEINKIP